MSAYAPETVRKGVEQRPRMLVVVVGVGERGTAQPGGGQEKDGGKQARDHAAPWAAGRPARKPARGAA